MSLVPLPPQPAGVPWPTDAWPAGPGLPPEAADLVDDMLGDVATYGQTYAVAVVQGGRLLAERTAGALEHFDRPPTPVTPETPLLSWSMAKSILHAAVGILVGRRLLDPIAPAAVPGWRDDERAGITLGHLLTMRDGLDFVEDYDDAGRSDVIEMLFGAGQDDVAGFAAARPARHEPGAVFNYSSGTSNIVARLAGDVVGDGGQGDGGASAFSAFLHDELFAPIGMRSAQPGFDAAGTFVGSSYVHATARDFARFGLLALRGGRWDGRQLLPEGWIDHGRTPRSIDPDDGRRYGAHWWVTGADHGGFWANGFDGQSILCVPAADLVVVRLGRSPQSCADALLRWRGAMADAVLAAG